MPHIDPDRRAVVAGAGLLAFLAAPALAADGDAELVRLGALLDVAWLERAKLELAGEDIEEAYDRCRVIVVQIEPLPATTLAGLIVKTRACSWCHSGEPFEADFFDGETTDMRLAASILRDLLIIGGKPVPFIPFEA